MTQKFSLRILMPSGQAHISQSMGGGPSTLLALQYSKAATLILFQSTSDKRSPQWEAILLQGLGTPKMISFSIRESIILQHNYLIKIYQLKLMQQSASLEDKQHFLRAQILESGVDPEAFMAYMGTVKNEGEQIMLQNWSLSELKSVVVDFKKSLEEEIARENKERLAFRRSKEMMTSRIMESVEKKEKVYYDGEDLWDYEIHTEQECKKVSPFFDFRVEPEVGYKSWDIKKSGGFLFGIIGSKNELELTLISNFTQQAVVRRSEDVDWLRETLCSKFPGSYIPPLEVTRHIQPEDKTGIMRRVKQIISFLNSVVNFPHLVQNRFFHSFMILGDYKSFNAFKAKQGEVRLTADIGAIENLEGKFKVEISTRVLKFIKESSNFGRQAQSIYGNMEGNLRKVLGDLETLAKHTHYVANDYAKLHEKFTRMSQQCGLKNGEGQGLANMMIYLNNLFTSVGNQSKKNMQLLRDLGDQFLRYSHSEWVEFTQHERRYNNELNNYLTLKANLIKKKERNLSDPSKWQLDEGQQMRISRVNPANIDKEDAFEIMYPRENRVETETRIWQAYINDMYENSFKILLQEQEKLYLRHLSKYCSKMEKLSQEEQEVYKRFRQIFTERRSSKEK